MCYNFVMEKKYYTVAEFAKKIGVSKQSVYYHLERRLNKYIKILNGQKYISESALFEFSSNCFEQNSDKNNSNFEQNTSQVFNRLFEQLSEKDRQIAEKDVQITFKDKQIEKLQEQISELTKAFREAQALHAGTMQRELSDVTTANDKHRWWKFWQKKK